MSNKDARNGFNDVDRTGNAERYVRCLDTQYQDDQTLVRQKNKVLTLLDVQKGHYVLDAGCGTGVDAFKMAECVGHKGRIVGIDSSQKMVEVASKRSQNTNMPIEFKQASIYELPFKDRFFDRSRSDKTFQHLTNPQSALSELIRVTKRGGQIVVSDPDHDSLIIDTPFTDINNRFIQFRSQQMVQGSIGHQLYRMFKEAGLVNVQVVPLTAVYTNYEEKKASAPYLDEIWYANKMNVVTEAEAQKWSDYLRQAIENGRFLCLQTYMVTIGTIPSS
ncbi:MAG: methyltransferase domain-containing protein [Chloroflexota bacterium]